MSSIPTVESWLQHTNRGMMAVRSSELKAIDAELRKYWAAPQQDRQRARKDLAAAMAKWIGKEGPTWRNNPRNAPPQRMIEQLYNALNTTMFTEADLAAFEFQDEQRQQRLIDFFKDLEVVTRLDLDVAKSRHSYQAFKNKLGLNTEMNALTKGGAWLRGAIKTLGRKVKSVAPETKLQVPSAIHSSASAFAKGASMAGWSDGSSTASAVASVFSQKEELEVLGSIRTFIENLQPPDLPWGDFQNIVFEVVGETLDGAVKLMMEAVPFVGLGLSAVTMFKSWTTLAKKEIQRRQAETGARFVMPGGDIEAALASLQKQLDHLSRYARANAANATATFGGKLAGTFTDLGIASSGAITVASLLATLAARILDKVYEQKQEGICKRALQSGEVHHLTRSPLLSCYILLISDASDIINMVRAEQRRAGAVQFGSLGWKEEVEWIKPKYIDPILRSAAQVVAASDIILRNKKTGRFYLNGETGRITSWQSIYPSTPEGRSPQPHPGITIRKKE